MDSSSKSKSSKFFTVALVFCLIVLLPLGSVIINFTGAKRGQAFYNTLKNNYGGFPVFSITDLSNDTVSSFSTKNKVLVVSFLTDSSKKQIFDVIKPIVKTDQFREEVDNLQFLMFDISMDSTFTDNIFKQMNLKDRELWSVLRGGQNIQQNAKMPNNFSVALVDTVGNIRSYYDVRKPEDCKLLVEHISVMPIKLDKKVEKKEQKNM